MNESPVSHSGQKKARKKTAARRVAEAMAELPEEFADLLQRPTYAHLATVSGNGEPQSSPMWFAWDGDRIKFTHTNARAKFRNIQAEPRVAISVLDPDNPYRYLEVRGTVEEVAEDPTGAFYQELARRYSAPWAGQPTGDEAQRVVLHVRPTKFVGHG